MLDFIRGVVRPVITLGLVGAGMAMIFTNASVPDWYIAILGTAMTFWFVDRGTKKGA